MTDMKLLQLEALEACKFRGHTMGPFLSHKPYPDVIAWSRCKVCDMQVVVNVKPAPNGIDIGGEAVALTCEPKE
jgi:hypothetical protein